MKILFTSDLHLFGSVHEEILARLGRILSEMSPDVLVVSGDVSDMPRMNTYAFFGRFDLPVVFCLGNHEFARSSVGETLEKARHDREECLSLGATNIHCLDVEGHFDTNGVRFYGNVLWYDGSLCNRPDRDRWTRSIWPGWLDWTIRDFDPLVQHRRCVEQIRAADGSCPAGMKKVMVTHTVPMRALNAFDADTPDSIANCYSGVDDLFGKEDLWPDLALCGHTHRPAAAVRPRPDGGEVRCVNSGNDYYGRTGQIIVDLLEI